MTLVLAAFGRNSLWMLADRRLSYRTRKPRDNARKIITIETSDGVALVGYAGLGATALGNEPADWIAGLLRNRGRISLDASMQILCDAALRNLPRHMSGATAGHIFIIAAFIDGMPSAFSIGVDARVTPKVNYTRQFDARTRGRPPLPTPFFAAGSGAPSLVANKSWERPLMRLIRRHDDGLLSPHCVAQELAAINAAASICEPTVGPTCIVVWRVKESANLKWGSGHAFFTGRIQDDNTPSIPSISQGIDVEVLLSVMLPYFNADADAMMQGHPALELNKEEIDEQIAAMHTGPHDALD